MHDGDADRPAANRILDGRLILRQSAEGHRAGTDAILLAAAAAAEPEDHFIDVGAGVGTAGLAVALHQSRCRGVLLEIDETAAAIARSNVAANGLSDRVSVASLDLFDGRACRAQGLEAAGSLVLTNPPFFLGKAVRSSPDPDRARAHVLPGSSNGHGGWLARAATLVAPHGRLLIIHRPDALPALLEACEGRIGGLVVRAIHPREDRPAHRILLGGTRGSRGPFSLLPPLVLHRPDGAFTAESEAIHRGAPLHFWPKKNRPRRAGFRTTNQ